MLEMILIGLGVVTVIGFFFLRSEMSDDDQDGDETTY